MSRLCALGAVVLVQASAAEFDYDKYVKQYAGGYDKYMSQGQGQGPELPAAATLAASPIVLAEQAFPMTENATQDSLDDLATMSKEAAAAEAVIAKIQKWNTDMKANLKNKMFSEVVAKGILTKVQTDFYSRHQELNRTFDRALEALDPATLAQANSSVILETVDVARAVIKQIRQLDHAESKEMRRTLNDIGKAGKLKAKSLWREAKVHAKQVHAAGKAAAKTEKRAGMHEGVYEREEGKAESESERLLGHIEGAAERAEDLIEDQFGQVEHNLERKMDEMEKDANRALNSDKDRLSDARDRVEEARRSAAPAVFLAQRGASQDLAGATLIAPVACAMMMVSMLALVAARGCVARVASVQRPLLG